MKKFFFTLVTFLTMPGLAMAQSGGFDREVIQPPTTVTSFGGFIDIFNTLIGWLFTVLLILSVIFIILAAFSYLTAGGEEEKISTAHKKIIYAVVALVVAFLAQGIRFVVAELLGAG